MSTSRGRRAREASMDGNDAATMVDQLLTEIGSKRQRLHVPGFGTLVLRGRIWWIRYSVHGQRREESSKSPEQRKALRLLRTRVEARKGSHINPAAEARVRMDALFDALEKDYQDNGRRSLTTLKARLRPLRDAFGSDRAIDVTAARIEHYKTDRLAARRPIGIAQTKGYARASVNRELAALRRAFGIAVDQGRVSVAPRVRLLAEHNARQGFVMPVVFGRIVDALPEHLKDITRFSYRSGWRKGEVLTLEWPDVDREGQRITLRREHSKTGEPRTIPFVGELGAIIARRWEVRGDSPYVFHHNGRPIRGFRKAWATACKAAGVPGLLFHDLRRSAVRNLVAAGVDQAVAMRITGHKTVSVFQRYRIVADDDVRAALARTEAAMPSAGEHGGPVSN